MKLKYTYQLILEPDCGVALSNSAEEAHQLSLLLGVPVLVRHNDALYQTELKVTPLIPDKNATGPRS